MAAALRDRLGPVATGALIDTAVARELRRSRGLAGWRMRRHLHSVGAGSPPSAAHVIEALELLVRERAADHVLPGAVGTTYDSFDAAEHHVRACLDAASLPGLADVLGEHPDGVGLRRPIRRRPPQRLLLDEAAPLGSGA